MARSKRRKKARRERLHREPIVREVARLLATGHPTQWRWTSEARHGLRAAMCLKGMAWELADKRAGQIIEFARHRIGLLHYPTWSQAQGELYQSREYFFCASCGGYMRHGAPRPWCSNECFEAIRQAKRSESSRRDDAARKRAVRVILTGGAPEPSLPTERACRGCGKLFTPKHRRKDQRYCGWACSIKKKRHSTRPCLVCAAPFQPSQVSQLTCGPACHREELNRRRRSRHVAKARDATCAVCSGVFIAKRSNQRLCSSECQRLAAIQRATAHAAKRRAKACKAGDVSPSKWGHIPITVEREHG